MSMHRMVHRVTEYNGKIEIPTFLFIFLHNRHLTMVLSSLIHCVEQFFLIGLISLAIVFATIRAQIAKILAALRAAGLSPLFVFSLLGILSIYGGIVTVRYCACRQVSPDEEYGVIDLEVVEGRVLLSRSSMNHGQVNHFFLVFASHSSNIC